MKAHVIAPVRERVLTFAIEEEVQPQLSAILKEHAIEEYKVGQNELGQDVGYLAGFPGFDQKEKNPESVPPCKGVMCLCGISNKRMNTLLDALNKANLNIPLKAMVTATNQKWSFAELVEELSREREAFRKQQSTE